MTQRKNLYQNISLRVPRSRQAQKKALLLALKLRRLSGHICKNQSNSMFVPEIQEGRQGPVLALARGGHAYVLC